MHPDVLHRVPVVRVATALLVTVLATLSCARPRPERAASLARTRSPHGDLALDCARCHEPAGWSPVREDMAFDHGAETAFALTDAHGTLDCESCHLDNRFDEPKVARGDCAACHVDVHAGALGTGCASCHDTRSFAARARREAHRASAFPLTGRHRQIGCEACHGADGNPRLAPLATECVACHAAAYRTAAPDHAAAGFPIGCASCHGTLTWRNAQFQHARQTAFALEGVHDRISCQSCHRPPDFALRFTTTGPRDCISCHRVDYDRAHPTLGFSENCLTCHSLDTFRGARWAEHEARFPIYSGAHARRWTSCTQCHEGQGFTTVTCLTCHEHSQSRMDDKHRGRNGYSYTTAACLNCHPQGREK